MDFLQTLADRNALFAETEFDAGLKIIPSARTIIVGCVDPRVDPMDIFKLEPGEAVIIRNVGGRINPALFETLKILAAVAGTAGQAMGQGWTLIVLHHTHCGIVGGYRHAPELLADYMGVAIEDLEALAVEDPYAAVAVDVAMLRHSPDVPAAFIITGMVYDVATGRIETVVPPRPARVA